MSVDPHDARRERFDELTVFAFLWAAGILSHMASYGQPLRWLRIAIFAVGLVVIFRPWRLLAFLTLLALHAAAIIKGLPHQSNHSILAVCVDLTTLTAALWLVVTTRSAVVDRRALYELVAPVLRIELIVLYFFVVFHKLNSGYFDPQYSCTAVMYSRLAGQYFFLPALPWVKVAVIYLTILIEAAIPIMLLAARWRVAGLLLAFGFHFALAMDPGRVIYNFSAILLGLFFLFTPSGFSEAAYATLAPARDLWARAGVARAALDVLLPVGMFVLIFRDAVGAGIGEETGRALWVVYAAGILSVFLMCLSSTRFTHAGARHLLAVRQPVLLLFPALLFANGAMPYIGAKTETAFAMFSNLRTEGGMTNHFLVPVSWQLFGYQRDLVTVHQTSVGDIQAQAEQGLRWVYYEFRSIMHNHPEASLTYERGGAVRSLAKVSDDQDLRGPHNPLLRRLLYFRPVPADPTDASCVH